MSDSSPKDECHECRTLGPIDGPCAKHRPSNNQRAGGEPGLAPDSARNEQTGAQCPEQGVPRQIDGGALTSNQKVPCRWREQVDNTVAGRTYFSFSDYYRWCDEFEAQAAEIERLTAALEKISLGGHAKETLVRWANEALRPAVETTAPVLRVIPSAWMKVHRIPSTPDQPPGEIEIECYAGDDPPDAGPGWIPLFRTRPAGETSPAQCAWVEVTHGQFRPGCGVERFTTTWRDPLVKFCEYCGKPLQWPADKT